MTHPTSPSGDGAVFVPLRAALERAVGAQYEIVRLLGRGGMGAVVLARDRALERLVAIKVLNPEAAATDDARERFRREARVAAGLTHPNVVPLYSFGEAGDTMYFVMGYVPGESLARRLRRDRRVPAAEAARILAGLADALDYAHRQGVVHRDIKPDNILLDDATGRAMLADFGIARAGVAASSADALTRDGVALGTPQYMSPEQAAGGPIDGRSDLYSLGVTGYQMLSGRLPFEAERFADLLAQHLHRAPPPLRAAAPDTPSTVAAAVMRCLSKDPAARWPDGRSLRDALAPEGLEEERLPERVRFFESLLSTAACLVAVLLGLATWMTALAEWPSGRLAFAIGSLLWVSAVLGALLAASWLVLGRHCGFGWRDVLRIVLRQPAWWFTWYPRALRRAGSMWDRLPLAVQALRTAIFVVVAGTLAIDPLLVIWVVTPLTRLSPGEKGELLRAAFFGAWLPAVALLVGGALWWGRRHGLSVLDTTDLVLRGYRKRHPFWRQPRIAALLRPVPSAAAAAAPPDEPRSTRECYERIVELASAMSGGGAVSGAAALEAARRAIESLDALDDEETRLASDLGPAEAARAGQRLASLGDPASDGEERRQLRALLAGQIELARRIESRIAETRARRRVIADSLKELWRALAAERGASRSGEVRSALARLEASLGGAEQAPENDLAPIGDPTGASHKERFGQD